MTWMGWLLIGGLVWALLIGGGLWFGYRLRIYRDSMAQYWPDELWRPR